MVKYLKLEKAMRSTNESIDHKKENLKNTKF